MEKKGVPRILEYKAHRGVTRKRNKGIVHMLDSRYIFRKVGTCAAEVSGAPVL